MVLRLDSPSLLRFSEVGVYMVRKWIDHPSIIVDRYSALAPHPPRVPHRPERSCGPANSQAPWPRRSLCALTGVQGEIALHFGRVTMPWLLQY